MARRATRVEDSANREVLDDLLFGLAKTAVLKAAIELEVCTRIAEGHRTVPALARIGGAGERGTRILLDAMCFIGLLSRDRTEYKLSPTADAFLVKGKPTYFGDAFLGGLAWDARGQLSKTVRTGKPMVAAASDAFEPIWAGYAASHLADWQRQLGDYNAMWDKVAIASDLKTLRVLDVACGSGITSFALAKRFSVARVVALDRAMILPYAKQLAEAMGIASQVSFVAGDALNFDARPDSFDLVLFSSITQYLSPEQIIGAFRKAYESLVPNGRIVITAPILDDDHKGPGEVPLAAMEPLLFSADGDVYPFVEYRGMLEATGFSEVTSHKDDWGLVTARRIEKTQPKGQG
ncbi:MAG: class I SAM-dependent methyltransferase [Chloroflexi bacterium]|nr:class I SAM-dependent methyltransferase [Chloroflexota bacterium]